MIRAIPSWAGLLIAVALVCTPTLAAQDRTSEEGSGAGSQEADRDLFQEIADYRCNLIRNKYSADTFTFFSDTESVRRPYLIGVQSSGKTDPGEIAGRCGPPLLQLKKMFFELYREALELKEISRPVVVLIFESYDEYRKIAEKFPALQLPTHEGLGGFFRPENNKDILYTWNQERLVDTLLHEGLHQLMHHAAKDNGGTWLSNSPWLQEGFAEYFGGHHRKAGGDGHGVTGYAFEPGAFLENRFAYLHHGLEENAAMTVRELVGFDPFDFMMAMLDMDSDERARHQVLMIYAQGWALTMYLHHAQDGSYRKGFNAVLKAEIEPGSSVADVLAELLFIETDEEWAEFDEDFRAWCRTDLRELKKL